MSSESSKIVKIPKKEETRAGLINRFRDLIQWLQGLGRESDCRVLAFERTDRRRPYSGHKNR